MADLGIQDINIYCDESCHLQNDGFDVMVIGAISCPTDKIKELNDRIREIKSKYGVFKYAEIKWTKVSNSKLEMYKDLIRMFNEYSFLKFRAVVATHKRELDLKAFGLTYNDWYYRIYYFLLKELILVGNRYHIYLDIKDTIGSKRVSQLKTVLNRTLYDFFDETVKNIQLTRSDQVQIMQLTDLLIGAVSYTNRGLMESDAKISLIREIEETFHVSMCISSSRSEEKFNIFKWTPRKI